MRNRVIVTAVIMFAMVFIARYWLLDLFTLRETGDFGGALMVAHNVLAGREVYAGFPTQYFTVPYPLTAGVLALPFTIFEGRLATALFMAASVAAMAAAIVYRTGQPWRLLLLFSAPFIGSVKFAQWSPLIVAAWYIPILAPTMAIIKPQIALPVALNRISRPGWLVAGCLLLITLVICPTWPIEWLGMSTGYEYFIPILAPGGFLLALAALKWKDERARLLLGMAALPMRGPYDPLALCIIPENIFQMAVLVLTTWLAPYPFWYLVALGCLRLDVESTFVARFFEK